MQVRNIHSVIFASRHSSTSVTAVRFQTFYLINEFQYVTILVKKNTRLYASSSSFSSAYTVFIIRVNHMLYFRQLNFRFDFIERFARL